MAVFVLRAVKATQRWVPSTRRATHMLVSVHVVTRIDWHASFQDVRRVSNPKLIEDTRYSCHIAVSCLSFKA